MSENYRELSDKVVAETNENPQTPEPKPQIEYVVCKGDGTLYPINESCPLCGLKNSQYDYLYGKGKVS